MPSFADLDVTASRSFGSNTVNVGGIETTTSETTKLTLELPKRAPLTASFCQEGLGHKLIKLFKKELQTKDEAFDAAVYVSTATEYETAQWLADDQVRGWVLELVEMGVSLEITDTTVIAKLPMHDDEDDPALVSLVETLLRTPS